MASFISNAIVKLIGFVQPVDQEISETTHVAALGVVAGASLLNPFLGVGLGFAYAGGVTAWRSRDRNVEKGAASSTTSKAADVMEKTVSQTGGMQAEIDKKKRKIDLPAAESQNSETLPNKKQKPSSAFTFESLLSIDTFQTPGIDTDAGGAKGRRSRIRTVRKMKKGSEGGRASTIAKMERPALPASLSTGPKLGEEVQSAPQESRAEIHSDPAAPLPASITAEPSSSSTAPKLGEEAQSLPQPKSGELQAEIEKKKRKREPSPERKEEHKGESDSKKTETDPKKTIISSIGEYDPLLEAPRMPGRPPGIGNIGASCFGACILHLIANNAFLSEHLTKVLSDPNHRAVLEKTLPIYAAEKELGIAKSKITIKDLMGLLPYSEGNSGVYAQQDAHELLLGIIGSACFNLDPKIPLEALLKTNPKDLKITYNELLKSPILCLKTWKKTLDVSAMKTLEGSRLERVDPKTAFALTHSIELPLLNVNLLWDQKTDQPLPLSRLLENYFNRHLFEPENYRSGKVDAPLLKDEIYFDKAPEILVINLIRQDFNDVVVKRKRNVTIEGQTVQIEEEDTVKRAVSIHDPVPVPRDLALPANGTKNHDQAEYTLQSLTIHLGGSGGGHYVANVNTVDEHGSRYWHLDDARNIQINDARFIRNASRSYVAIYVKKPPKAKEQIEGH